MRLLKLYGRFILVCLKSRMEYKVPFFISILVQIYTACLTYLGIWILLQKFKLIQGWNFYEIMLLHNMNLFSYGMSSLFFKTPMVNLEGMVQRGTFDTMLIYPLNPFLHLIFKHFNHHFIGHITISSIVFGICFRELGIAWTISKAVWFGIVLLGAWVIQASLMVLAGSLNFWFLKSTDVVYTVIFGVRGFVNYPLTIYDKWVQILVTFIIPYAFLNFFPVQLFLQKSGDYLFHPILQYGTPVIALVMFGLACLVWNSGINRYQSAG